MRIARRVALVVAVLAALVGAAPAASAANHQPSMTPAYYCHPVTPTCQF
jgi:hypothetical protein